VCHNNIETCSRYIASHSTRAQESRSNFSPYIVYTNSFCTQINQITTMCSLDLCFVLDCSSSMSRSIEKIQPQLKKLCKTITFEVMNKRRGCDVRYSTVFFRDHDYRTKRLESLDFTPNIDEVIESLSNIETIGGNDVPEDVLGGLDRATSLSWQSDLRFLIFIGDAPCHGLKYHSLEDAYPDGDPLGLTPESVLGQMKKKNIQYLFVKLSSDTNKMIEIFQSLYHDKKQGLELQVLDCRKEQSSQVKEKLSKAIKSKITVPISLVYAAARSLRQHPEWRDFLEYLPLEMQDVVIDVPQEDIPIAPIQFTPNPVVNDAEKLKANSFFQFKGLPIPPVVPVEVSL